MATVLAVCISEKKGVPKHETAYIDLVQGDGIAGDAHAGNWHRQVSLLADESIEEMRGLGYFPDYGAFAENIVTSGIELKTLPVGTMLRVGSALLCVTQIGKECHNDCAIRKATGKCVMPTEGIFAVVLKEGRIEKGNRVEVEESV